MDLPPRGQVVLRSCCGRSRVGRLLLAPRQASFTISLKRETGLYIRRSERDRAERKPGRAEPIRRKPLMSSARKELRPYLYLIPAAAALALSACTVTPPASNPPEEAVYKAAESVIKEKYA